MRKSHEKSMCLLEFNSVMDYRAECCCVTIRMSCLCYKTGVDVLRCVLREAT